MSKKSEAVKRWRKNFKSRIVSSMGGKCCVCGYNKCDASLVLHHLDPSKKDFTFSKIRANPKNWKIIVEELRKCVLVCANCHNEIHSGLTLVPVDAPSFNEAFDDYESLNSPNLLNNCPVCEKLKPKQNKNCSYECAGRSRYKINWGNINLQEELKTKSIVKLSEEIGCSDIAIHKRLKKLGLK